MEQLIPIASKLQDVLGALGQSTHLDLPQIVVVGGQSSGKSSVLESLVGRSFLPRGTGIVTRRPLILQLSNTQNSPTTDSNNENVGTNRPPTGTSIVGTKSDEWGEFLHQPGKLYYDFNAIRKEIIQETERLTGSNKGVDDTPIRLKVCSPRVLTLTVIDLPGIAKVPVGDQPHDIERQIQDMCMKFISNPNAIILAVTSANTDLANSDAIKLAQSIDPAGNRTIGVLTKVDLMDEGTDCAEILMNQVVPLRRGYIAVINRSQKDVVSDVSIREGLKKEEKFFAKHPVYSRDRTLLSKCGTTHLGRTLNAILMHHIRDCLPDLKGRIAHMMSDVQKELDALGSPTHHASRSNRGAALLSLISKFSTNFGNVLDGKELKQDNISKRPGIDELYGGARISYIFQELFAVSLNSVGAFDGLTDEEIRTVISNANGTRPALFVPEISFDILVRRQVARLEQPGVQCVDMVYEELQRISAQSEPGELTRFPILRDRLVEVVSSLLRRCVSPTQMMVSNLVKIELAYINTSHPDFIGGSRAVAKLMDKLNKEHRVDTPHGGSDIAVGAATPGAMGATPLSSSSLNNYGYEENVEYKDAVMTTPHDKNQTGLMNFIFRGGGPGVGMKTKKSQYAKASTEDGANERPPSVVYLPPVPDTMRQTDFLTTDRERVELELIKSLVESYFAIVRKNFIDMVPKTIMYFLVNHIRDSLQNELVSELYREAELGQLLQEAEDIAVRRKTCNEMKELLGRALEIVNEVRDFSSFK